MNELRIEETQYTPEVVFLPNGTLSIRGRSYPENTFIYYEPVLEWLKDYFNDEPAEKTVLEMEISYFNSSSSKVLFDLLDILDAQKEQHSIQVNWIYHPDNESAEEAGEDFIADFEDLDFRLVTKSD